MTKKEQHYRRSSERIPVDADIWFFDKNCRHPGKLLDCSSEGMLIETKVSLPLDPRIEIVILTGKELLNVPAQIIRINKKGGLYTDVGVKILCNSEKYMQFVVRRALRDVSKK